MNRRTVLKLGLAGGVVLGAGGLALLAGRDAAGDRRTVLAAIVPVLLAGALPAVGAQRERAVVRAVTAMETAIGRLAPDTQRQLDRLFTVLASAPGQRLLTGVGTPWERADDASIERFLEAWRGHRLALLQSAYQALHDLALGGWYADESTWPAIGYPGPLSL